MKALLFLIAIIFLMSCDPNSQDFQDDSDLFHEVEKTPEEIEQEQYPGIMTFQECLVYEFDNIHMCVFECIRTEGCNCENQCNNLYCSYPERIIKWKKKGGVK